MNDSAAVTLDNGKTTKPTRRRLSSNVYFHIFLCKLTIACRLSDVSFGSAATSSRSVTSPAPPAGDAEAGNQNKHLGVTWAGAPS